MPSVRGFLLFKHHYSPGKIWLNLDLGNSVENLSKDSSHFVLMQTDKKELKPKAKENGFLVLESVFYGFYQAHYVP